MSNENIPVDEKDDLINNEPTEEVQGVENEVEKEEEKILEQETTEVKDTTEQHTKTSTSEQLEKELSEMKDKYLRIFAEFDNYRKRTVKERQDIIKLAAKDVLMAVLPALDDFERAIKAAEGGELPAGIMLIYNKLAKTMEHQGLKEMVSTGEDFNADLHEALTKVPAPSENMKGKVIDTIEKGYYLNDKIVRYAKVVVGE